MEAKKRYIFKYNTCDANFRRFYADKKRRSYWWNARRKWADKLNLIYQGQLCPIPDPRCGYPDGFLYPGHPVRKTSD